MRYLFLTIGAPGSGKSTWIKEQGLEPYTLSPDSIRQFYCQPEIDTLGRLYISQENDKIVWKTLFEALELRMKNGETIIVDATHSRPQLINRYKKLVETYKYRIIAIDFRKPLETILQWNRGRLKNEEEQHKYVPEDVIEGMYYRLQYMNIPSGIKVIKPHEFENFRNILFDFNDKYDTVYVIGDIHSCYDELQEILNQIEITDNAFVVFVGDYFDRGNQPVETFKILQELSNKPNTLLLTGNHEEHLIHYEEFVNHLEKEEPLVSKIPYKTRETFKAFYDAGISVKEVKQFYRKLGQLAYFKFGDKVYFINHGGYPTLPTLFTKTKDLIHGVGKYEEVSNCAETWKNTTPDNYVQIHGHRKNTIKYNDKYYVLNGNAEQGGTLKYMKITKDSEEVFEINLGNYEERFSQEQMKYISSLTRDLSEIDEDKILPMFKSHDFVNVQPLVTNNTKMYSIQFTKKAFFKKEWDTFTTHARGLFITESGQILARGYTKFFNINEREETRIENLKYQVFPARVFLKENGFLGILGVINDDWFISSKSSPCTEFAQLFKELIEPHLNDKVKEYLTSTNSTLLFEVIDPIRDPHIVEYTQPQLVLLDSIRNTYKFEKASYEELKEVHSLFSNQNDHFQVKQQIYTIQRYSDLKEILEEGKQIFSEQGIEGYVLEFGDETTPYQIKFKTQWYKFWKSVRTLYQLMYKHYSKHNKITTGFISEKSAMLHKPEDFKVFNILINHQDEFFKEFLDIPTIRKLVISKLKDIEVLTTSKEVV